MTDYPKDAASAPAGDGVRERAAMRTIYNTATNPSRTKADMETALSMIASIAEKHLARPRAAVGDWSFDMTSAPEGVDLLVYRHDGGTVPWVNGVRAIASKEDGEWYGDNGDAITTPAAWTALQSPPAKGEG